MQPPNPDPRKSGLQIILVDQADELMAAAKAWGDSLRAVGELPLFWRLVAEAERRGKGPADAHAEGG